MRTNLLGIDKVVIWNIYLLINHIEQTFRSFKSELGLRPIYHQKEQRTDGQIFITILAYHLVQNILLKLKNAGINLSWATVRRKMSTHVMITSTMQTKEGKTISIRKPSVPTSEQQMIYDTVGIRAKHFTTRKILL